MGETSRCHVESTYGFYHGQDPRCFTPDFESCTEQEIAAWKKACEEANAGTWKPDDSGCHHNFSESGQLQSIVTKTSMGIGVYQCVLTDDGDFVRDATFEDLQREEEWTEQEHS